MRGRSQQQSGWDRRAWLLLLLGGSVCGFLSMTAAYAGMRNRSNPHEVLDSPSSLLFYWIGIWVLPGVITALARRMSLLWASSCVALMIAWRLTDRLLMGEWTYMWDDFADIVPDHVEGLLLICLPIALVRYLRRRQGERQLAAQAAHEVRRQASVPQPGVWPPPPDYRP